MKKSTSVVLSVLMVVSMLSCLFVGSASAEGKFDNLIPNGDFENYAADTNLEVDLPTSLDELPNFSSGGKWGVNVNDGYYRATWAETIKDKDGNEYPQEARVNGKITDYNTFKVVEDAEIAHSGSKYLYVEGGGTSSLGLENLEKNTTYLLSFYWRYAEDNASSITGMAITTTVNIGHATLGDYKDMKISLQNVVKGKDLHYPIVMARNTDLTPNADNSWKLVTISFNSKDFNKLYFVMSPPNGGAPKVLIDDMYCAKSVNIDVKPTLSRYGTITKPESDIVALGSSVTVEAKPYEGNTFEGWYVGGEKVSSDAKYTFVAEKDTTLTPKFSGETAVAYNFFEAYGLDGTFEKESGVGTWSFNDPEFSSDWCNVARSNKAAYEGDYSLCLNGRYRNNVLKIENLEPHSRYDLSFFFKLTPNDAEDACLLSCSVTDPETIHVSDKTAVLGKIPAKIIATGEWQKVDVSFNNGNNTSVNVIIRYNHSNNENAEALYVDNFQLMAGAKEDHYYLGGCDTTCEYCGEERVLETIEHTYDSDCDADCNVCGATREVAGHTYAGDCDTTCDKCGAEREATAEHTYANACDTDCDVCGATREAAAHVYDNDCDADCNVCGATREVTGHTYAGDCDTTCDKCGAEREATAEHTYANACDTDCDVCGTTREVNHVYDNDCDKDCNVCGATRTVSGHKYTNACDETCNICGAKRTITHSYKTTTTKATLTKNGSIVKKCSVCGKVASTTVIYYPNTVKIAATTYTYTGKVINPAVTVKNSKGTALKNGTDYTVTYGAGRKNVGKYKVTVTFKGNYTGTKTFYFTINPVKTTVSKLTAGKKSIKVNITKKSTQVKGYQIQYSTSKTFKSAKTKTVSSYKTTSTTLTKLTAKKTYYVRVRTYKTVGKTNYYSGWSTYKYTKTK